MRTYEEKRQWPNTPEPMFGDDETALLSYALPKARLPKEGERLLLVETELHPLCLTANTKVETRGGVKPIKDIREADRVISSDISSKTVRESSVTASMRRTMDSSMLLDISYFLFDTKHVLTCSPQHRVYSSRGWVPAGELTISDQLYSHELSPPDDIRDMVIGTLLGNSCLLESENTATAALKLSHSEKQLDYLQLKIDILSNILPMKIRVKTPECAKAGTSSSATCSTIYSSVSHRTVWLGELYRLFYANKKKIVPKSVSDYLSPIALAFWYMDTGSILREKHKLYYQAKAYELSTHMFTQEETEFLCKILKEKYGLSVFVVKRNTHYGLRIVSINKFRDLISPYIPISMTYKFFDRSCLKCHQYIPRNYSVCPGCLLDVLKTNKLFTKAAYAAYYSKNKRIVPPTKTLHNWFGSWEEIHKFIRGECAVPQFVDFGDAVHSLRKQLPLERLVAVPIIKIEKHKKSLTDRTIVYDLEVNPDHNFFANGVLVSNSYLHFQGNIPHGNYGAGNMKIIDQGQYKIIDANHERMIIEFHGKHVEGRYAIVYDHTGKYFITKVKE